MLIFLSQSVNICHYIVTAHKVFPKPQFECKMGDILQI